MKTVIFLLIVAIAAITVLVAFTSANVSANDQIRLKDISQIQKALKIYFDENGYYPQSNGAGIPSGINNYLDFWPQAPDPNNKCSWQQNTYYYIQKNSGQEYLLTFCLGRSYKEFSAGVHSADSKGIR